MCTIPRLYKILFCVLMSVLASPENLIADTIPLSLTGAIYPSPDPFTLDARAAQLCINLLRQEMFLLGTSDSSSPGVAREDSPEGLPERSSEIPRSGSQKQINRVRRVWARLVEVDREMPPGHRRRYIIEVNGEPLDMSSHFIEWNGSMVNLQLLFTYRNQYPPRGLNYRADK